MGHDYLFRRPRLNTAESFTRGAPVSEGESEFSGHFWLGSRHQVQLGNNCPPTAKPSSWEVLNEIGENRSSALAMEVDDFRRDPIAPHDRMVDLPSPCRYRAVAEICVEPDIPAFLTQTGRRIDRGFRICPLPVAKVSVVERVGRDEIAHRTAPKVSISAQRSSVSAVGDQRTISPLVSLMTAMRVG